MATTCGTTTPVRGSVWRAWGRALLGGAVMACALGAGNALGEALARLLGAEGYLRQLLPAALVSALAVPAVLGLRAMRSTSRRPMGLGPRSSAPLGFLRGLGVTASCAAVALGAGTGLGWVHWSPLDPAVLASFLVGNALVAVLLEALPEEATLRGYAWASLRDRLGGVLSALGTTAVFLLVPHGHPPWRRPGCPVSWAWRLRRWVLLPRVRIRLPISYCSPFSASRCWPRGRHRGPRPCGWRSAPMWLSSASTASCSRVCSVAPASVGEGCPGPRRGSRTGISGGHRDGLRRCASRVVPCAGAGAATWAGASVRGDDTQRGRVDSGRLRDLSRPDGSGRPLSAGRGRHIAEGRASFDVVRWDSCRCVCPYLTD